MTTPVAETRGRGRVWPVVTAGAVVVAAMTPFTWVLLLVGLALVEETPVGDADLPQQEALTFVAGVAVSVALYLLFCGVACWLTRRSTLVRRRAAVVVALAAHLVLWLGLSALAYAQMAASGVWL